MAKSLYLSSHKKVKVSVVFIFNMFLAVVAVLHFLSSALFHNRAERISCSFNWYFYFVLFELIWYNNSMCNSRCSFCEM